MASRWTLPLAALSATLVLAGCSSKNHLTLGEPALADATTTTQLAPSDPYAVPAVIDVAYMQQVMQELENIRGQILNEEAATHEYSELTEQRLRATTQEPELDRVIEYWSEFSMSTHPNLVDNPGPSAMSVTRVVGAAPSCAIVTVDIDNSVIMRSPAPHEHLVYVLKAKQGDAAMLNPTPWQIAGVSSDLEKVSKQCAV